MPDFQSPVSSQSEFISELTSFYTFLTNLHLPLSSLKTPPPTGWPTLTPENLSFLSKSTTAVNLIKYLPIIDRDTTHHAYQIYEKASSVDYTREGFQKSFGVKNADPSIADPLEEICELPGHVVTIAQTSGVRNGHYVLCDTERWTVTICDFQVGVKMGTKLSLPPDDPDDEDCGKYWQCYPTYTPKDFFEMLKDQYRRCEVFPTRATDVRKARQISESDAERMREVYTEYGWPGKDFRKEECMKKAEEVWEEIRH